MYKYVGIIFDVKDSKKSNDRKKLQVLIEEILTDINQTYESHIALNFTITLGDEFQGLLNNSEKLFEIIYKIKIRLDGVKIRCGIGIGTLETVLKNKSNSLGTDGSVWWNARQMIDELKKDHEETLRKESGIKIKGILNQDIENLVNHNFILLYQIESKFTEIQNKIIKDVIKNYGINSSFKQTDFAKVTNRDVKSVNKILNNMKYYDYVTTFKYIEKVIEREIKE